MKNSIMIKISKKILILTFWLFFWELGSLFLNSSILLPKPLEVFKTLIYLSSQSYFWKCIVFSVIRVSLSISISIILGIIFGIICGSFKFLEELIHPVIVAIKAIPVMSIIILALVWFKSNIVVIFTTLLIVFPIMYTNVLQGIKCVNNKLLDMASLFNVKKIYIIKDIYIPSIKPYIVSGILMCLGIGWKVAVASEILSTPKYSIGFNIFNSKATLDTSELFAWTLVVVVLSFLFEKIFNYYATRKNFKGEIDE